MFGLWRGLVGGMVLAFDKASATWDWAWDGFWGLFPKIWKDEGKDFNQIAWMAILGFTVLASWRWVICISIFVEQLAK